MSDSFERDYEVEEAEVFLSIVTGNKQIGTSVVKLSGKPKGVGDIKELSLGKGTTIAGKELKVKTVVTDTNDQTNKTSVTYKLAGGKKDESFTREGEVDEEGGSMIFRTTVTLIKSS